MIKFILLGLVQGVTEFFPVSSSGHLVILQHILGIDKNVVFLDVILHLGTLCSLLAFLYKDILILFYNFFVGIYDIVFGRRLQFVLKNNDKFKLGIHLIFITLITGTIAVIFKDFFERQFENINTVAVSFFIMSIVLFLTKNFMNGQRQLSHVCFKDSLLFGLTQALAIMPGISRSGTTMATLLFRNFDRESSFKLSFFALIPVTLGAFILKLKETQGVPVEIPFSYLLSGFITSFVCGLAVLYLLRAILKYKKFHRFSYYCFFASLVVLFLKLRGIL
jgi:undecaprenyl-diphosphatase